MIRCGKCASCNDTSSIHSLGCNILRLLLNQNMTRYHSTVNARTKYVLSLKFIDHFCITEGSAWLFYNQSRNAGTENSAEIKELLQVLYILYMFDDLLKALINIQFP